MPERGQMTVREAGRRGGRATSERHGPEHYQRIGRMGAVREVELVRRGKEIEAQEKAGETERFGLLEQMGRAGLERLVEERWTKRET